MYFFQDIPSPTELLAHMAGAVRDCIDRAGSAALAADAMLLWDEFDGEDEFRLDRSDDAAMELARRMGTCLAAIAGASDDSSVAELALISCAAFAEGARMTLSAACAV